MGKNKVEGVPTKKRINEWELYKNKFGKYAYIVFPLVHIIVLAILAGIVVFIIHKF